MCQIPWCGKQHTPPFLPTSLVSLSWSQCPVDSCFICRAMAPSFLNFKDLRRRSRASFRTERSADASSDASHGTTPTSGSLTPPSIGQQSDPALDLQVKEPQQSPTAAAAAITRPPPPGNSNSAANRYSVSGMAGLGYPAQGGRGPSLPVSQFSPRIVNVPDNSWVSPWLQSNPAKTHEIYQFTHSQDEN